MLRGRRITAFFGHLRRPVAGGWWEGRCRAGGAPSGRRRPTTPRWVRSGRGFLGIQARQRLGRGRSPPLRRGDDCIWRGLPCRVGQRRSRGSGQGGARRGTRSPSGRTPLPRRGRRGSPGRSVRGSRPCTSTRTPQCGRRRISRRRPFPSHPFPARPPTRRRIRPDGQNETRGEASQTSIFKNDAGGPEGPARLFSPNLTVSVSSAQLWSGFVVSDRHEVRVLVSRGPAWGSTDWSEPVTLRIAAPSFSTGTEIAENGRPALECRSRAPAPAPAEVSPFACCASPRRTTRQTDRLPPDRWPPRRGVVRHVRARAGSPLQPPGRRAVELRRGHARKSGRAR